MEKPFTKSEDFVVLLSGGTLLALGLLLFFVFGQNNIKKTIKEATATQEQIESEVPFKTVAWYEAFDDLKSAQASKSPIGKWLKNLTDKPGGWKSNPLESFFRSDNSVQSVIDGVESDYQAGLEKLEKIRSDAVDAETLARTAGFADPALNTSADQAVDKWRSEINRFESVSKKYKSTSYNKVPFLIGLLIVFILLFGSAQKITGASFLPFMKGFIFVFFIAVLSHFLAGQSSVKNIGMGYAAWAILLGLIISNTIGTPSWVKPALTSELFIKTGLIVLGAEILFNKILAIGLPGIFVAWIVTPIVLITTYWFGQKVIGIKSKTLNMTVSADMSVCGVSAAVATAAACKASKEELTLAVGLSMVFTSIMMIVLPIFINFLGLPEVLGGAWIGGTIDATGAVVAAGAFLGDDALNVAATIKMIQNILIGIIAFGVAVYFSRMEGVETNQKIGWDEIWKRFPKFILGFIGASIVFSLIYSALGSDLAYGMIDQGVIGGFTKNIRGWLFCIAFVSIGLSTNFRELKSHFTGGKPLILYVCGQAFNLALTLLMAYLMFYKVFPHITEQI